MLLIMRRKSWFFSANMGSFSVRDSTIKSKYNFYKLWLIRNIIIYTKLFFREFNLRLSKSSSLLQVLLHRWHFRGCITYHIKASSLAFSDSTSLLDPENEFLHNSTIRGNKPQTTKLLKMEIIKKIPYPSNSSGVSSLSILSNVPSVIIEPMSRQPVWVLCKERRLFWLALLSSSSAVLNIICKSWKLSNNVSKSSILKYDVEYFIN